MTELVFKVDDDLAARFKEISQKKFRGNDSKAFKYALKSLLSEDEKKVLRFEEIVQQIQKEIKQAGGLTGKQIDEYIAAYRRLKKNSEKQA